VDGAVVRLRGSHRRPPSWNALPLPSWITPPPIFSVLTRHGPASSSAAIVDWSGFDLIWIRIDLISSIWFWHWLDPFPRLGSIRFPGSAQLVHWFQLSSLLRLAKVRSS
jgi:hypothetical protein